jgi:cytochrome b561
MTRVDRSSARYTRTAVVLHWLIGAALAGEIVFGFLLREIPRNTPLRGSTVNLHKSLGIALGLLILVRLAWRIAHRPPPLLPHVAHWQVVAARTNHAAMYACMIVIPLAGYLASNVSAFGIKLSLGPMLPAFVLPPWGPNLPWLYTLLNGVHNVAAYILTTLIVLHVAATLKHAWIDRDRPFARLTLRKSARF